jgi:hypothetical protein
MEKYFVCGIVDLSKREIISGNIERRIKDFEIHMDSFRDELDWWFTLLANTLYPDSIRLRKPIVIELFEFSDYMIRVIKQINEALRIIQVIYEAAGRKQPIEYLEEPTRQTIMKWRNNLKPYRNQIAVHRYTTKDGKFLKVGDIMRLFRQISDEKLSEAKTELFDCHNKIRAWLVTPANRNHLVLARKK